MDSLDDLFRRHGYVVEQHMGVSPYSLFERSGYVDLDREFQKLHRLSADVEEATRDDDSDAALSIWNESTQE